MGHKTGRKPNMSQQHTNEINEMNAKASTQLPLTDVPADWDEQKDVTEFTYRFGEDQRDAYERGLCEIEHGLARLDESLSYGLTVLLDPQTDQQNRAIEGLTIPGKIDLFRQAPNMKQFPASSLQRLEEDLARCTAAYRVSDHVLGQFVLARGDVWLVEIADTADGMVTAGFLLKESVNCEYARLASPVDSTIGVLGQVVL